MAILKKDNDMATCTFKMNRKLKQKFSDLCLKTTGYTMYKVFNILAYEAIRHNGLQFSLVDENGFFPEEAEELLKRVESMKLMLHQNDNSLCLADSIEG